MAELVLSSAMGKLESLLVDKAFPFPAGAKEQVKVVRDDLEMALDLLNNSGLSAKKVRDEGTICQHWMSEVVDMAHDADVAIDLFIFKLQQSRKKKRGGVLRWHASSTPKKVHKVNHIRDQIDAIRKKIEKMKEYGRWESSSTRSTSVRPHRSAPWIEEPNVVGLNKDVEFLLQKVILNEDEKGVCVSSIVGMGGVGKTTLAKLLYNDRRVVYNFPSRVWIYVTGEFSLADVLRKILDYFVGEYKVREMNNNDLLDMVAERLKHTRYFIVLDDVWRHRD